MSTVGDTISIPEGVQYPGWISCVQSRVFSTPGGYHDYTRAYNDECGGYHHEYSRGCSVHRGNIMSTPGLFSVPGEYHKYTERIRRCMWEVIMSTPGDV